MPTLQQAIDAFQAVSQPLLYEMLGSASCIASSRVAVYCFQELGFEAYGQASQWTVLLPTLKLAFVCGYSAADRARLEVAKVQRMPQALNAPAGYEGHVVAIIGNRYLIDASFNQAFDNLVSMKPQGIDFSFEDKRQTVVLGPVEEGLPSHFDLEATFTFDDGSPLIVRYTGLEDQEFMADEAWTQDTIPFLAGIVLDLMRPLF